MDFIQLLVRRSYSAVQKRHEPQSPHSVTAEITNVLTSNKCTELAMPIALIQQFVVRHQPVREENLRL